MWYSTPVTNLIICSDPSPRTLVRLPDTPGGAQRPPGAAGERRRGRRPLSGRPGRLREERRFGPGGSKSMFHCLTTLHMCCTAYPRPGNPLIPPDPDPELFQCECDLCAPQGAGGQGAPDRERQRVRSRVLAPRRRERGRSRGPGAPRAAARRRSVRGGRGTVPSAAPETRASRGEARWRDPHRPSRAC